MIYIRGLAPEDAAAVARLEARLHDRALRDEADVHRRRLEDSIAAGVNLCFGAFENKKLVGYLLCYGFEPTVFADEKGDAIYIEDIAVAPRYRTVLPRLLRRFMRDIATHFPGVAIEAHAVERMRMVWRKHTALFARGGFALEHWQDTGERVDGQARYALRGRAATAAGEQPAGLEQVLRRLPTYRLAAERRSYEIKLVRQEREWDALESIWDDLLLALPDHTVFQCYRYQRLWWRHFGDDSELLIILLVLDGEMRGIAPLRTCVVDYCGTYRRQLTFIGSRWEVDRPQLLFPRDASELIGVLVRFLADQTERWEIADFYEQQTTADTTRDLAEAFRAAGLLVGHLRDSDCPYLPLTGTWKEYLAARTQKLRKNLNAAKRRLSEYGALEYCVYDSLPAVSEQLDRYREIEQQSWKKQDGVAATLNAQRRGFYREMAEVFSADGAFIIRMLSAGGREVAGTFGVLYDSIYYSLQIAHDGQFDRCSPGTYLESLELEDCFAHGYRGCEFLGGFLSNKTRWTQTFRYTTQLCIYRKTPALVLRHVVVYRIKPWVKELIRPFMKSWPKKPPV